MQQSGRTWVLLGVVAGVAAAVGAAVGLVLVRSDAIGGDAVATTASTGPDCGDADRVELRVFAAPAIAPAVRDIARSSGDVEESLRCVDIVVTAAPASTVSAALGRGWNERTDGPPPHVWVPTTSNEVALARRVASDPMLEPDPVSIATSPSVIAMPQPMADELGWPDESLTWTDVAELTASDDAWAERDRPAWGPFTLSLVEDLASEPSIGAMAALTRALGALPSPDHPVGALGEEQFQARAQLLELERKVEYLGASTAEQLDRIRAADERGALLGTVSALPLTEQMVWRYNGGAAGDDAPDTALAAWYPKDGSSDADYPYVRLDASWTNEQTDVAATAFLDALVSGYGSTQLRAAGFRDETRQATPELFGGRGVQPDLAPGEPAPVPAQIVGPLVQAWRALSQTGNLLAVVDVSGSMRTLVPGTDATRLDLSKQGLEAGLALLDPASSAGLWEFSTDLVGSNDHRILVPIGPLDGEVSVGVTRRDAQLAAVRGLTPRADTGLYDTIAASYAYLLDNFEPGAINAVIFFTDGQNDDQDGITFRQLRRRLRDLVHPEREVLFVGVAYGRDADFDALKAVTSITGGMLYTLERPEDIRDVFIDAQTGGLG